MTDGPEHDTNAQGTGTNGAALALCVVLLPPGKAPDEELIAALGRHGLAPHVTASPHLALAELCRRGGERRVLLIADPSAVTPARRVIRAAERYAPTSATWIFDPGSNPPVRAFVDEGEDAPAPPADPFAPVGGGPRPGGSPMLRLIAAEEPMPAGPDEGDEEPTAERLLSADELTMLLAEDGKGRRP